LIEKKSCSRGYYYGVIESIINYWQPRKQNKKNLLQTETEEDKIKKKQNYDLKLKIEFSDDFVCTLIF